MEMLDRKGQVESVVIVKTKVESTISGDPTRFRKANIPEISCDWPSKF